MNELTRMKKKLIRASIGIGVCLLIGFLSSAATEAAMTGWFSNLEKPGFTPSKDIFKIAWAISYILMGIAAGLVWSKGFYHKWVKVALYHFGFQLILTASWPIFFFGLQNTLFGLLNAIGLFILVLYTIKWFRIVSDTAVKFMYPYAAWIIFVLVLNFEIWRLNM